MGENKGSKGGTKNNANLAETSSDSGRSNSFSSEMLNEIIEQTIAEMMRGRESFSSINMVCHEDFAGTSSFTQSFNSSNEKKLDTKGIWIVDTGALNHMCCDINLMLNTRSANNVRPVTLPDGSVKIVKHIGDIKLSENLMLNDVLYIPLF